MAMKIRLARGGSKKRPHYSIVAADSRSPRYGPLLTEDGRSFGIRLLHPIAGAFTARLTGIESREAAEALKGTRLYAPRDRLPPLPDDEFYHTDLIGLAVVDTGGASLGTVRAVLDHGAGDILEIARPGAPDLLLPFPRTVVPTVDLPGRRIVADPPEGLVE